jgi:hypothetical protein
MSPETAIYEFLRDLVDGTLNGTSLDAEVHPHEYSAIESGTFIRVGNCESQFSPGSEGLKETGANIVLQIVSSFNDVSDLQDVVLVRDKNRELSMSVADAFFNNDSLGGRVCSVKVERSWRGSSKIQGREYATVLMPLVINPY